MCAPRTKLRLSTNCQVVISRELLTGGAKLNGSRTVLRTKGTAVVAGFPKVKANLLRPTTNSLIMRLVGVQR